jgi:hypothetical protein
MRLLWALFLAGFAWLFIGCLLVLPVLVTIIPSLALMAPLMTLPFIYANESSNP